MARLGSFQNMLMRDGNTKTPEEGMDATIVYWTDRRAARVVAVSSSQKRVTVKGMMATARHKGLTEAQDWLLTPPRPETSEETYSLRKNGRWILVGQGQDSGRSLLLGYAEHYIDPTF